MGDMIYTILKWGRAVHAYHWDEKGPVLVKDENGRDVDIRYWAVGRYVIGQNKKDATDPRFFPEEPLPRELGPKHGITWK
jgi:hypothetical protein